MKWFRKPLMIFAFAIALSIVFIFYKRQEHNNVFGCPVVNQDKVERLIAGKQRVETPSNLLLYQYQELPFQKENNTFLVPGVGTLEMFKGNISSRNGAKVYLKQMSGQGAEGTAGENFPNYAVYVLHEDLYYETCIQVTPSIILAFYTDTFEKEHAYGKMVLYTPKDHEIGTYSVKSSEAKLSYDVNQEGISTKENRNYTLELYKDGMQHKMNLAGLRKDDDWELDALPENEEQILLFFQRWNEFCATEGEKRFTVNYQVIEFYMDDQHMGNYLLRVPLDEKQIDIHGGYFLLEEALEESLYSARISALLSGTITDPTLHLEYLFWQEKQDGDSVVYALPRRFQKIEQPQ
ncbi:MAG: hypothetical protein K2P65_13585 [Lachnospiraceae bacterium]|nr:hypothetical protein [Lachnospiraceae bacterium]